MSRYVGRYESEVVGDEKRCTVCGKMKPLSEYHRNGPDGPYRGECKSCYNIKRREDATKKRSTDFAGNMRRRGEDDPQYDEHDWKDCVLFFEGVCCYCGATPRKGQRLTHDHLVPFDKGGKTVPSNIVPACQSCNSSKGNKEWRVWYMAQLFFNQERMNRIFQWRRIMRLVGNETDEED